MQAFSVTTKFFVKKIRRGLRCLGALPGWIRDLVFGILRGERECRERGRRERRSAFPTFSAAFPKRLIAAFAVLALLAGNIPLAAAAPADENPVEAIATPEMKILADVSPDLVRSDNFEKEKKVDAIIADRESKAKKKWVFFADTEEDAVKLKEADILKTAKSDAEGGWFSDPKPIEETILEEAESSNETTKAAANRLKEELTREGAFHSFVDKAGEEKGISTKLVAEGTEIKPQSVPFETALQDEFAGGNTITELNSNVGAVTLDPETGVAAPEFSKITTEEGEKYIVDNTPQFQEKLQIKPLRANQSAAIVADNKILYKDAFPGVDILKSVETTGVKENYIIKDQTAPREIKFKINTVGLTMQINAQGGMDFYDAFNEKKFSAPAPFLLDKDGKRKDLNYALSDGDNFPINSTKLDSAGKEVEVQDYVAATNADTGPELTNTADPSLKSSPIYAAATKEYEYTVAVRADFSGLTFPINLDPTVYITLQDRGQATFYADYSDGTISGNEGFMNGYGQLTRGNEPVQSGGTRVENTSSDVIFVDPDGRRIAGKIGSDNTALSTNSTWFYQLGTGFSGGSNTYYYNSGLSDLSQPESQQAFVEYTFTGTEIWAGFSASSSRKIYKAVVDEGTDAEIVTFIDPYVPSSSHNYAKSLIATGLASAAHTVRLYPYNAKNVAATPSTGSSSLHFDYFEYYTAGNELADTSAITINSRATAGFDFASSLPISYSALGNVPNNSSGKESKGTWSSWIKTNFAWNADTDKHFIWSTDNQRLYYLYDGSTNGNFYYEQWNGSNWTTVQAKSANYTSSNTFASGETFHVAVSWDASTGTNLYVNNAKVSYSGSGTARDISSRLKVGGEENKKLLLHAYGSINDSCHFDFSGNGHSPVFNADAKISTTQSKFGGSAYYFDGTADRVSIPDSSDLEFGSDDFTIDLWVYPTTDNVTGREIIGKRDDASFGSFTFYQYGTVFYFYASSNGSAWDIASQKSLGSVDLNTWTHLSIARSGNNFYAFKNGVQQDTWSFSGAIVDNSIPINIGATNGGGEPFQGYVDELRITKGYPLWTSGFTAPTAADSEYANLIIAEPAIFNYVLADNEIESIYESPVAMSDLISGSPKSAAAATQQQSFAVPQRSEELRQTSKSLLFNFPGVQTADSRVGAFGGLLFKTTAPSGTAVAESAVNFEGDWTDAGNYRYTNDLNSYATYTTAGNATEIWAAVAAYPNRGIVEYIIDEGTAKELRVKVDIYSSSLNDRYYLLATGIENTTHTIKVRPLGIKNPVSTNFYAIVGLYNTADRMFYYGTTPDIATQDMVVNGQTIKNVLTQDYGAMPNAIQFTDKGNISESAHEGTISAWVQTSWAGDDGVSHVIASTHNASNQSGLVVYKHTNNAIYAQFKDASATTVSLYSDALTTSTWAADVPHHVVVKWWRPTSSTFGLALYLDGKKIAENKSQTFTPSAHSQIMLGNLTSAVNETYDFDGAIYDLSIWSWAFDDGGVGVGADVLAESEVWKSWKSRALLNREDLSSQVDGSETTFKFARGGLQTTYGNTYDTDTKLLIHSNTTDGSTTFTDSSASGHNITPTSFSHQTEAYKFGSSAMYGAGTYGYLAIPDSADFDFSDGTWTVDTWVNLSSLGDFRPLFFHYTNAGNYILGDILASGAVELKVVSATSTVVSVTTSTGAITTGSWYHVAFVENGDSYAIYVNGVSAATATDTDRPANYNQAFWIGAVNRDLSIGTGDLYGYIDEFRVSDVAEWTSGFTPETSAYNIVSSSANSLASSIAAKNDGSSATISSAKAGTFALLNDATGISKTDASIVIDGEVDEAAIDTSGGYLTLGWPGSNRGREIVEYSAYSTSTNTFTVSERGARGTYATAWPDNTPIEVGGTFTLASAPASGSKLFADYYYTGSSLDSDRGDIAARLDSANFLDVTESASTGWDFSGSSANKSGGQHVSTQVAGQNAFGYFEGPELSMVFSGDSSNGGIAEFIVDEGTADERRVRVDQNSSTANQAYKQIAASLDSGYHTFRMVGGVDESNAGSNKYSTVDAFIFGTSISDLGAPDGSVADAENKNSNQVNGTFYWPAWEDSNPLANKAVTLSGTLSGYYDYSEYDVTIGNVTVSAYTGSGLSDGTCDVGDTGCLDIDAKSITVTGTINASGAGYGGGGGGGGGSSQHYQAYAGQAVGGSGGSGVVGGSGGSSGSSSLGDGSTIGRPGGSGGGGGGTYGGSGGGGGSGGSSGGGSPGSTGNKGGYATSQGQGDASTDESLLPGSGGGGGGGGGGGSQEACHAQWGGGAAGGGAGNRGGGFVKLYADGNISVVGSIVTTGKVSSTGNGVSGSGTSGSPTGSIHGTGGGSAASSGSSVGGTGSWASETDCPNQGGAGGAGGAGAGGGVLLKAPTVSVTGSIDTRGGGSSTTNGGTLKIFYDDSYGSGTYYTGRTYSTTYTSSSSPEGIFVDGAISSSDDSIVVDYISSTNQLNTLGRPNGIIKIDNEYIKYTEFSESSGSATLGGLTRGYAGTKAASHSDNSLVYVRGGWRNDAAAQNSAWYQAYGPFPEKALLVATGTEGQVEGGLIVIDLDDNSMWGRFEANTANAVVAAPKTISAAAGKIFLGYGSAGGGLTELDFIDDQIIRHKSSAGLGYGSAAATKGTIAQANDQEGWSYTSSTGVALIATGGDYIQDIESYFDGADYHVWAAEGKSGTTGTSAGVSYISGSTVYDLTADTGYWGSKLEYDSANDDLYITQTKSVAGTDIWSKITAPQLSTDSTIDTADSTTRIISQAITNDLTDDSTSVYFATNSGVKKVLKSTFAAVLATFDSNSLKVLSTSIARSIDYDAVKNILAIGFSDSSGHDGKLVICDTQGNHPVYLDYTGETGDTSTNTLLADIFNSISFLAYVVDGYESFSIGTDIGISLIHAVISSFDLAPKAPVVNPGSFMMF